jgi:predicted patatin/cPLA2 family phospholipase
MLTAIQDLGFTDCFDAVYGCSSGSVNAAYFLAGECWYGLTIYFDELATKRFINFFRPLRGRSILDIHYAFDDVMEHVKPLDYEAVLSSPIPLSVCITLVDKRAAIAPMQFWSRSDLKEGLRAGGWIPIGVRGTALFRDERALDGGVLRPHPYSVAQEDGCTHVLSLSTKPPTDPPSRPSTVEMLSQAYLNRIRSGLGTDYIHALQDYRRQRVKLNGSIHDRTGPPYLLDLTPPRGAVEIKRQEIRALPLLEAAREAYKVTVLALEQQDWPIVLRLTPPPPVNRGD